MTPLHLGHQNTNHNHQMRTVMIVIIIIIDVLSTTTFYSKYSCSSFAIVPTRTRSSASLLLRLSTNTNTDNNNLNDANNDADIYDDYEDIVAAIIIPGFLTGSQEFETTMVDKLNARKIPTMVVPMPNWHWIPCLGGRSVRPILERVDYTVQHLIHNLNTHDNNDNDDNDNSSTTAKILTIPPYQYSFWDCWRDFRNNPGGVMEVGGSSKVDDYPVDVEPQGTFTLPVSSSSEPKPKRIALIGHSAGGWIGRIYLSSSQYGGKSYQGAKYVHTLLTLGTPHANANTQRPNPAFAGIEWINRADNEVERRGTNTIRSISVAGTGFLGRLWPGLTQGAYAFCCPDGSDGTQYDGDGVTPVFSALMMPGSEAVIIDNVTHFCWSDPAVFGGKFVAPALTTDHQQGRPWYGDESVVDQWVDYLIPLSSSSSSQQEQEQKQ